MASVVAGALFEAGSVMRAEEGFALGLGLPFWFFVVGMAVCLVIGLLIYRSAPAPAPTLQPDAAAAPYATSSGSRGSAGRRGTPRRRAPGDRAVAVPPQAALRIRYDGLRHRVHSAL